MNRKKLIIVIFFIVAVLIVAAMLAFGTPKLTKTVSVRGYEISIPENWSADSKGNFYTKKGDHAGKLILIDQPVTENDAVDFCAEEVKGDKKTAKISEELIKYTFTSGKGETEMYFIPNLKNPEPYGAGVVIYKDVVKNSLGKKIAESFKTPEFGANPPKKNIAAPVYGESENAVYKVKMEDDTTNVLNTALFNDFSDALAAKEDFGLNILSYEEDNGTIVLKSWQYIESSGGKGYMYTYYDKGEGIHTYDNNAQAFDQLSKVISDKESTTSYVLEIKGKSGIKLIEFPLDRIRDNASELIALKTAEADAAHIDKILKLIMSNEEFGAVNCEIDGDTAVVSFAESVSADGAKAYSYSAVIFSLAENINTVTVIYADGSEFTFGKSQVENATEKKIDSAADDEKAFVDYTEEVKEEINTSAVKPSEGATGSSTGGSSGEVVYSGTVVISYNTMVTHPRTGERVAIGPYAEARGYGGYLGKGISCVIKRSGSGYIATASCGGSVLASYPLNSEAELQWAIGLINAYS